MPHAVLGYGVLMATTTSAAAAGAKSMSKEEDKDLHHRLRAGTEDSDSGWGFGRFYRALEGKKPVTTEGGTPVAEKDDVSLKESRLVLIRFDLDFIYIFTRCLSSSGLDEGKGGQGQEAGQFRRIRTTPRKTRCRGTSRGPSGPTRWYGRWISRVVLEEHRDLGRGT
jgi:hypothetical protein